MERRAGGIIGLPYLSLILVALLTLKDDPNNGQKIVTMELKIQRFLEKAESAGEDGREVTGTKKAGGEETDGR